MRLKNNATQPELVSKMLCFFKDTREQPSSQNPDKKRGWHYEYFPGILDPQATAKAVLALARINEMLDDQINHLVFYHFTVKRPEDLEKKPDLDHLFYPDYGLRLVEKIRPIGRPAKFKSLEWPHSFKREKSVAIALQRMRAHVMCPQKQKQKQYTDLCSLVLHGPPGTGKTTLVEALAKTCGVSMVEVTPSDIVVKGEEAIERRARAVFEALSLLTRTVILFDEFDPVLLQRNPNDPAPETCFPS